MLSCRQTGVYFILSVNGLTCVGCLVLSHMVNNMCGFSRIYCTYNITSGGATGTQLHCTLEEYVIAVVELEHVQVHVVTFDERNTGVNAVEITAQNVRILTATEKADENREHICVEEQLTTDDSDHRQVKS